jgi:hypothetical protein
MKTYPTLVALVRYRRAITAVCTAAPMLLFAYAAYRTGYGELVGAGLLASGITWLITAASLELVELVSDTLMPR